MVEVTENQTQIWKKSVQVCDSFYNCVNFKSYKATQRTLRTLRNLSAVHPTLFNLAHISITTPSNYTFKFWTVFRSAIWLSSTHIFGVNSTFGFNFYLGIIHFRILHQRPDKPSFGTIFHSDTKTKTSAKYTTQFGNDLKSLPEFEVQQKSHADKSASCHCRHRAPAPHNNFLELPYFQYQFKRIGLPQNVGKNLQHASNLPAIFCFTESRMKIGKPSFLYSFWNMRWLNSSENSRKKQRRKKEPRLLRLSAGLLQHSRSLHVLLPKPSTGLAALKTVHSSPIRQPCLLFGSQMKKVIDLKTLKLGWEACANYIHKVVSKR